MCDDAQRRDRENCSDCNERQQSASAAVVRPRGPHSKQAHRGEDRPQEGREQHPEDKETRLRLAAERGFLPIVVTDEEPLYEQLRKKVVDARGNEFGDRHADNRVDLLIECSGSPSALAAASYAVRTEGQICVLATYPSSVSLDASTFTRAGQTMTAVFGSDRQDVATAQMLLRDGVVPFEQYLQIYPFNDAMQAMSDLMSAKTMKPVLRVNG